MAKKPAAGLQYGSTWEPFTCVSRRGAIQVALFAQARCLLFESMKYSKGAATAQLFPSGFFMGEKRIIRININVLCYFLISSLLAREMRNCFVSGCLQGLAWFWVFRLCLYEKRPRSSALQDALRGGRAPELVQFRIFFGPVKIDVSVVFIGVLDGFRVFGNWYGCTSCTS